MESLTNKFPMNLRRTAEALKRQKRSVYFCTLPYVSREIVSMLLGCKVEISPFSAVKYKLTSTLQFFRAASRIEELDSSSKIE